MVTSVWNLYSLYCYLYVLIEIERKICQPHIQSRDLRDNNVWDVLIEFTSLSIDI